MKKLFLQMQAVALLAIMVLTGFSAEKVSASSFKPEVRHSVAVVAVYVDYTDLGYGELWSSGTGFFIGENGEDPEYLITNHHVIEDFLNLGKGELVGVTIADGSTIYIKAKVRVYFDANDFAEAYLVDYNDVKDIAVLRLASATDKRAPIALCSPTDEMIGSTVYCVGYPGVADNEYADAVSSWGERDASVTNGSISRFVTTSGTGRKCIQTDAIIQHGNSGGPMVTPDGYVIGINTWGVNIDGESSRYAVSIDEAIPMLRNNNVPYFTNEDLKTSGGISVGQNTTLVIVIGAAVVLILVVVIILVAASSKKKSGAQPQMAQPMNAGAAQPMNAGAAQPMNAGAAQPMNAGAVQTPVQPVMPKKRGMVRSMSTQHNGVSFNVESNGILIGRDAAHCTIAYREGTPGVSGRHCSVTFNPETEEFLITDLRSTYGTFLMNGQRLEPNVPYHLRAGESFYVGENANVLRVEVG